MVLILDCNRVKNFKKKVYIWNYVPLINKSGLYGISTHDLSDNGAAITCS